MGSNICKEIGISPDIILRTNQVDEIWEAYDKDERGRLSYRQAQQFLKDFAKATKIPYNKRGAQWLIKKCDPENSGYLNYNQFCELIARECKTGTFDISKSFDIKVKNIILEKKVSKKIQINSFSFEDTESEKIFRGSGTSSKDEIVSVEIKMLKFKPGKQKKKNFDESDLLPKEECPTSISVSSPFLTLASPRKELIRSGFTDGRNWGMKIKTPTIVLIHPISTGKMEPYALEFPSEDECKQFTKFWSREFFTSQDFTLNNLEGAIQLLNNLTNWMRKVEKMVKEPHGFYSEEGIYGNLNKKEIVRMNFQFYFSMKGYTKVFSIEQCLKKIQKFSSDAKFQRVKRALDEQIAKIPGDYTLPDFEEIPDTIKRELSKEEALKIFQRIATWREENAKTTDDSIISLLQANEQAVKDILLEEGFCCIEEFDYETKPFFKDPDFIAKLEKGVGKSIS